MIVAGLALAILLAPMPVQAADTTPSRVEEPSFDPVTEGHAFRLKLPEGGTLGRRAVIDFDLYQVVVDGRPVLDLYEGFAADVSEWVEDSRAPGRQVKLVDGQPVEYFWNRGCNRAGQVHAWLDPDAAPEVVSRGREIADSIVMKPCERQ